MATSGADIVDYLKRFIGTPYVWGGNSLTSGVDCSGLIQQGFKHFGIDLPRVTYDQIGKGKAISYKGLREGDLIFFDTDRDTPGPDHVGIYMGNGKMLHAPRPGKSVEVTELSGYYMDRFMGGRRIDGVWSEGNHPGDEDTKEPMSPQEQAASYGWSYGFLNSNPELKKLFREAVDGSWEPGKFQAELRDTKWWKTNSETMRKTEVTRKTDPATWSAMVDAEIVKVQQLAAEIGAAIPKSKLKRVVETSLRTGMDEGQLRYALGEYVNFTKDGTLKGEAGMFEFTMKQHAADMGIELDDQTIKNQAQRVVRKVATEQDFSDELRRSAKSMYPAFESQIDAGLTLKDIASPYTQMMASELELPDSSIKLTDPTIKGALNGLDANGKPGGLSLTDFQSRLRNDPRWKETGRAQNSAMTVGLKVLQDMGLAGR